MTNTPTPERAAMMTKARAAQMLEDLHASIVDLEAPVTDSEVAEAIRELRQLATYSGPKYADLITKLAAQVRALTEERDKFKDGWETAFRIGCDEQELNKKLRARAESAESKLAAARAGALEEAAKICDDGAMIGDHPNNPSDWSRACREQARYIRKLATLATETAAEGE